MMDRLSFVDFAIHVKVVWKVRRSLTCYSTTYYIRNKCTQHSSRERRACVSSNSEPHISTRRLRTALNLDLIQQFYHIGSRKWKPTPTELDTTSNVLVYILDDMWKTLFFLFYREFRVFKMTNGIIDGNESMRRQLRIHHELLAVQHRSWNWTI